MLTKPGIIKSNVMVGAAAFLFASQGNIDIWKLLAVVIGTSCIIASGCVVNNYTDREIDKKMNRTKKRALVTGQISTQHALLFAAVLGAIGVGALGFFVNILTLTVGIVGFFAYTVLYGIAKRGSVHGTLVGTISGATPPLAGYTAVTNTIDHTAILLFATLVIWQMPHFFAIALFRLQDYKNAKIPVLPAVRGIRTTKIQMTLYVLAFTLVAPLLSVLGDASYIYGIVMLLVGAWWLYTTAKGFRSDNYERWARKVFGMSLIALVMFSLMLSIDSFLPR